MSNWEQAVERIKGAECPTGNVEEKVAGILADYGVAEKGQIEVWREDSLDQGEAEAYRAQIAGQGNLVILAKSGQDDYVARIVEVYKS